MGQCAPRRKASLSNGPRKGADIAVKQRDVLSALRSGRLGQNKITAADDSLAVRKDFETVIARNRYKRDAGGLGRPDGQSRGR